MDFDSLLYKGEFKGPYTYERYMGRVKIKEAPSNVYSKELIDKKDQVFKQKGNQVFGRDQVLKLMEVAKSSEDFFKIQKRFILDVLRDHLHEVKRVHEVF